MTQYVSRALVKKTCIECKKVFEPVNRTQKYCGTHCKETHKTKIINAKWCDRPYVDPSEKPRQDLTRIMRGDFREDRWSGRNYNACRG